MAIRYFKENILYNQQKEFSMAIRTLILTSVRNLVFIFVMTTHCTDAENHKGSVDTVADGTNYRDKKKTW